MLLQGGREARGNIQREYVSMGRVQIYINSSRLLTPFHGANEIVGNWEELGIRTMGSIKLGDFLTTYFCSLIELIENCVLYF